jgi:3-oxoadipate enol-lactonase
MKIEANDIKINYEISGKENAPVVVLSHSLACSLMMWNPQLKTLEANFRVLRYDTRGHGDSDAPAGAYTLSQLALDVTGLLDALDIETVHFVGLSMGGMIGQCLALDHGRRLRSLTLCDTAAIIPDEAQPVWQERLDTVREKGMPALVDATLQRWFTPAYLKQNHPEVELIRRQILDTPVAGYIGCSEAIRKLNYLNRLSEIDLPTLIMVGEDDPGTPVSAAEVIHAHIAGSKLTVLPSAAHLSNIQQSEAFNAALSDFLRKIK